MKCIKTTQKRRPLQLNNIRFFQTEWTLRLPVFHPNIKKIRHLAFCSISANSFLSNQSLFCGKPEECKGTEWAADGKRRMGGHHHIGQRDVACIADSVGPVDGASWQNVQPISSIGDRDDGDACERNGGKRGHSIRKRNWMLGSKVPLIACEGKLIILFTNFATLEAAHSIPIHVLLVRKLLLSIAMLSVQPHIRLVCDAIV